jgi:EAL domain-containing protein (putative c-di-GMP-specific phosphodiesterase class I)
LSTPKAKPVARAPTTPAPQANEPVTAESLGWQLRSALPPMRLHSVSLYNNDADVLWLSEGALGPDEHNVVVEGIEALKAEKGQLYHEIGLEDGRIALLLGIRGPRGDLLGTVMILADMKSLNDGTMDRILTVPVKTVMQKTAVFLRKMYPQGSDTMEALALHAPAGIEDAKPADAPPAAANGNGAAPRESLVPKQVEAILTLELVEEPPAPENSRAAAAPAAAAKSIPPAKGAASAAPAKSAANSRATAPGKGAVAAGRGSAAGTKAPAGASARNAAASPPPPAPLPEIEVLAFDPNIEIPAAGAGTTAADPAPGGEVLQFDANLEIPTLGPAPAATAKPAAAESRPAGKPARAASTANGSGQGATVAVPVLGAGTSATTTTARRPRATADDAILINDTGPVKKLTVPEDAATLEPVVPQTPPPPPLSAAETASDLRLYVQELIKLRSSGRTRRYEVLARSRRDADRNEVPSAFLADSARGGEGAALDALVVEHLLQWLGSHGETIWDSEPASFSVNLSIGALEDAGFPKRIGGWLERYNVPAEHVGFEISEFACVQCRPAAQRFVDACEQLGCFLVIDNFSFDSNMFEFLGSRALRHIKIDPRLTGAAMKEKLPQALVVAILQACKVLGVHCVAKRLDSQSSLQWLTAVGCDFAQSFQLEKPRPLDTLVTGKTIQALRE